MRNDRLAIFFKKWRQRNFITQRRRILIDSEAGPIGRDLEQNSVRLAEIKTPEIVAIDLSAVPDAHRIQSIVPLVLLLFSRRPESHVMHSARA